MIVIIVFTAFIICVWCLMWAVLCTETRTIPQSELDEMLIEQKMKEAGYTEKEANDILYKG